MNNPIRVALDSGPLRSGDKIRGIGVHTRLLAEHLQRIEKLKVDVLDFSASHQSLRTGNYDIIHYTSFRPFARTLPFKKYAKTIVTVHDLIPLIYPEKYPPGVRGNLNFIIQKYLVKRIDAVITISETSKKDIVRILGIDESKIHVVHLAPNPIFKKLNDGSWRKEIVTKYKLPAHFVLYVGDVNYNKNILTLAQACKMINIPLVMAGKQAAATDFDRSHPENRTFVEFLKKYAPDPNVKRLGFVSDEDLVKIYNLATVYCQPSFYEGFGLPVLEALASGTVVLASRIQAHKEIGSDCLLYADADNVEDFARNLTLAMSSQTKMHMIKKGLEHVKIYSWEKVAKQYASIYEKILQ